MSGAPETREGGAQPALGCTAPGREDGGRLGQESSAPVLQSPGAGGTVGTCILVVFDPVLICLRPADPLKCGAHIRMRAFGTIVHFTPHRLTCDSGLLAASGAEVERKKQDRHRSRLGLPGPQALASGWGGGRAAHSCDSTASGERLCAPPRAMGTGGESLPSSKAHQCGFGILGPGKQGSAPGLQGSPGQPAAPCLSFVRRRLKQKPTCPGSEVSVEERAVSRSEL